MIFIEITNDKLFSTFYNEKISIYDVFVEFLNLDLSNYETLNKIMTTNFPNKNNHSHDKINTLIMYELLHNYINDSLLKNEDRYFFFDFDNDKVIYTNIPEQYIHNLTEIQSYFIKMFQNNFSYNFLFDHMNEKIDIKINFTFYNDRIHPVYELNDILSYCFLAISKLENSKKIIKVCENCGDFFIPSKRNDEIYCDNVHENGRTCKNMGYENKIKDDEVYREYRRLYKNKNAKKQRQKIHDHTAQQRFDEWVYNANIRIKAYEIGEFSKESLLDWFKATEKK